MRGARVRAGYQPRSSANDAYAGRPGRARDAITGASLCPLCQRPPSTHRNALEGRYKACLVQSNDYLMRCYRYIELNPVRARMVAAPADYAWSSFHRNANLAEDSLVRPHPIYMALGEDAEERATAYRDFVRDAAPEEEIEEIRLYLQRQYALGSARFREFIEAQLRRRAGPAKIGRPAKDKLSGGGGSVL